MKVAVIIEQNSKGRYSAYIQDDRIKFGVLGEGKTEDETIEDFRIGYEEIKETYLSVGKRIPEIEFEFKTDSKIRTSAQNFDNTLHQIDFV